MSRRSQKVSGAVSAPVVAASRPNAASWSKRRLLLAGLLAVASLALYAPTWWYGTLSIDDPLYVIDNVHVTSGLTARNVAWSFSSVYDSNWIPLTWISLMLDVDLYGGRASGFHITNSLLHAACAVLLFWWLAQATGRDLPSAFVAALFALHPLHVESVAWIAERKDVLSIFFGMISLWAYVRYARRVGATWINFAMAFVCLALSLMAKQTLVTLPFVFLLLDLWPLGRMPLGPNVNSAPAESKPSRAPVSFGRLVLEKLPFFGLTAVFAAVASYAQSHGGAVVEALPWHLRLLNAVVVYAIYLGKMLLPMNLVVYYPHPGFRLGWGDALAAAALLVAISAFALYCIRRRPYVFVGWAWYLGTLVPLIGLVQIGGQQMADRYTYFPLIGIFFAITWLIADGVANNAAQVGLLRTRILPGAAVAVLAVLWAVSFHQIGYWHDSIRLLSHEAKVLPDQPTSHQYLAAAYLYAEQPDQAIPELEAAIRLAPPSSLLQYKVAGALEKTGHGDEAVEHYQAALKLDDNSAQTHNDFGVLLMNRHQDAEARRQLERAIQLDPNLAKAEANLSLLCAKTRDYAAAIRHGERALALDPKQLDCYHYIAVALRGEGHFAEAIQQLEQLLKLDPHYEVARKEIALTRQMQARQRR